MKGPKDPETPHYMCAALILFVFFVPASSPLFVCFYRGIVYMRAGFSGNMNSVVDPCNGAQAEPRGGLDRKAFLLLNEVFSPCIVKQR
ncbi:hypothetical protein F5X98DRAFT_131282 [Xylaria grammica]|nr:hypothetical protein F5X98DRAFT_131282 [Xylaria grammica]